MISQGVAVLISYCMYLAPGLLLFGLWFALTSKSLTGMRYGVLAATLTHGTAILLVAVPHLA